MRYNSFDDLLEICKDIKETLSALNPNGYCNVNASIGVLASRPFGFAISLSSDHPAYDEMNKTEYFETAAELFDYAFDQRTAVNRLPNFEDMQKAKAVRDLGRAIDAAREVGLDVDGIAESFQGVWENLLTDQRPADYRPTETL